MYVHFSFGNQLSDLIFRTPHVHWSLLYCYRPLTYLFLLRKKNGGGFCKHFFFLLASQRNHKRDWKWENGVKDFFFSLSLSFFFPSILLPLFFSQCFSHSLVWVQVMFRMFLNQFCFEFKEGWKPKKNIGYMKSFGSKECDGYKKGMYVDFHAFFVSMKFFLNSRVSMTKTPRFFLVLFIYLVGWLDL